MEVSKGFENYTRKRETKETKWTGQVARACFPFQQLLVLKYGSGAVKLPGLSRNGPQVSYSHQQ